MKVIAINGSPRPKGNTSILISRVFEALQSEGIDTEFVQLGGRAVRGCRACYRCFETKNCTCVIDDDGINEIVARMMAADGIILASPTYVTDVTAEMKALIDRATLVLRSGGDPLRRRVGAAVVAVRRAGATHAFDTLNHFFTINQMVVAGSNYWNLGLGRNPGDVLEDEEGLRTMRVLGENMAWLLKKLGA